MAKKQKAAIGLVFQDNRSKYFVSRNEGSTEVCVGIVAKGERMTQDEFLTRLQKFIDTARKKGINFLDIAKKSSLH